MESDAIAKKKISVFNKAAFAVALGLIGAAGLAVSPLVMVTLLFVPLPAVYSASRYGWPFGLITALITIAPAFALGAGGGGAAAALFFPAVGTISYCLIKKKRSLESAVYSVGSYVIGTMLVMAGFLVIAHTDVISYLMAQVDIFAKELPDMARQLLVVLNFQEIAFGTVDPAAILVLPDAQAAAQLSEGVRSLVYYSVPQLYAIFCIAGGFSTFLIARAWLKKRGVGVCALPAFKDFCLPKGSSPALAAALALSILVPMIAPDNSNAVLVASIGLNSLMILAMIIGMSFADFFMAQSEASRATKTLIIVLIALMLPAIFILLGAVEQFGGIKKRMSRQKNGDDE